MYSQLFELLRIALRHKKSLSRDLSSTDWNALYNLSLKHALLGMVFEAISRLPKQQLPPKRLLSQWYFTVKSIEQQNRLINRRVAFATKTFFDEGFRCCLLKGQGIALLYPNPLSRQAGDIDMWVDASPRRIVEYVHSIMPNQEVRYHHVEFPIFQDVNMEVHFRPSFMCSPLRNKRLQAWFKQEANSQFENTTALLDEKDKICIPTPRFNAVYQLVHIYRHVFDEGVGLRHLMDYYFVLLSLTKEDKEEVMQVIVSLGIKRFAASIMWTLREVFDIENQFLLCPPDSKSGAFLLNEIMMAGNLGHYDPRRGSVENESDLHHFIRKCKRNCRFIFYYPEEALWEPLFRFYHCFWRKAKLWK